MNTPRLILAALALTLAGMVYTAHSTNGSTTHIVCETTDPATCR